MLHLPCCRTLALVALLGAVALPAAEDSPLATWLHGSGELDGQAQDAGVTVAAGQVVASRDEGLIRLELAGIPGSRLILAAASGVRLQRGGPDNGELLIVIERGVVQVDLPNHGPWTAIRARAGVSEATALGTLFVIQRVERDRDYVALVRGRMSVSRLAEDATEQQRRRELGLELEGGQGLAAGPDGLGQPETLLSRPQLSAKASEQQSIQAQGLNPDGHDWAEDLAALLSGLGDAPGQAGDFGLDDGGGLDGVMVEDVLDAITEDVSVLVVIESADLISELTETINDAILTELSEPPPPPID